MKRILTVLAVLLCVALVSAGLAEEAKYTEKAVPFIAFGEESGEVTLRFYEDTPNVAYIGFAQAAALLQKSPLSLQANRDGTLTLKNDQGGVLLVDTAAGTMTANDWAGVVNPPVPLEGEALGMRDSSCRYTRLVSVVYEGEPVPVIFDFAKYGIRIYADDRDVYLPVSTANNLLTDLALNHLRWDREHLYLARPSLGENEKVLTSETLVNELHGAERPEDIRKQSYADLCFAFDYFFGHPGTAKLDAALGEKGLDRAITDLGEEGEKLRKGLQSPNLAEYMTTVQKLFAGYLSDGHTAFMDMMNFIREPEFQEDRELGYLSVEITKSMFSSKENIAQMANLTIPPQRKLRWGDEMYREYGSTAIIRLDTFLPDEEAWAKYYSGEGEFPRDSVGTVVSGLRRASENPAIKNVIFDLSCNGGGSSDMLMLLLGLTTGQNRITSYSPVTGRKMTLTFETDNNFDGVFDEKDRDARFDFNYGVLTTRYAFSCGNLFPIVMREGGAVVIGEPSSGGSCCIQEGIDAEGFRYFMSSGQWLLLDAEGNSVEGGCKVDIPIEPGAIPLVDKLVGLLGVEKGMPLFLNYFDDANLDTLMNAWFRTEQELAPAA